MNEGVRAVIVIVALTLFVTFVNCTFLMTIKENSRNRANPPNVFQWQKGWDCTRDVWRGYMRL